MIVYTSLARALSIDYFRSDRKTNAHAVSGDLFVRLMGAYKAERQFIILLFPDYQRATIVMIMK